MTFAIRANVFGVWSLAFVLIVEVGEVVDDEDIIKRFEFPFGTLPDHPELGKSDLGSKCPTVAALQGRSSFDENNIGY